MGVPGGDGEQSHQFRCLGVSGSIDRANRAHAVGIDREGGAEAMRFFTEPKNVCLSLLP